MIPNEEVVKIDNTEAVQAFSNEEGRILHVRPECGRRGVTFAYKRKGGRVTFATSVQHRHDAFTKKIGTKLALEHFRNGQVVSLPISGKDANVVQNLRILAQVIQF